MTPTQTKEIRLYLEGPRDYDEGLALYRRYGLNLMLKQKFTVDRSLAVKDILINELRKLAGMSEREFRMIPRRINSTDTQTTMETASDTTTVKAPETVQKMIRFREKFAFLNSPECPDVLKVLTADMFTAYDNYRTAHAHLQQLPDETVEEAATLSRQIVESYLDNREIWDELEHYRDTGEILGKCRLFRQIKEQEELAELADVALMRKLASARTNVSKAKKALDDAADDDARTAASAKLQQWTDKKIMIEGEIERRKKK